MNIRTKKVLIILLMLLGLMVFSPNKVNAGLQANKGGTSLTNVKWEGFFIAIRKMESEYGTLGKKLIVDNKYNDTIGNGIDCHMALNTEFGTAGILAYSKYGEVPTTDNDTTTGNESGVYQLKGGNREYVSATDYSKMWSLFKTLDEKYYNCYNSSTIIPGDGIGMFGYDKIKHGGNNYQIFYRYNIFSGGSNTGGAWSSGSSRAVVVCGQGL